MALWLEIKHGPGICLGWIVTSLQSSSTPSLLLSGLIQGLTSVQEPQHTVHLLLLTTIILLPISLPNIYKVPNNVYSAKIRITRRENLGTQLPNSALGTMTDFPWYPAIRPGCSMANVAGTTVRWGIRWFHAFLVPYFSIVASMISMFKSHSSAAVGKDCNHFIWQSSGSAVTLSSRSLFMPSVWQLGPSQPRLVKRDGKRGRSRRCGAG